MGIMGIFGQKTLTENLPVGLTSVGKTKADNLEGEGAAFAIMATIAENGGVATIKEISQDSRIPSDKVQAVVKRLIRSGYVKVMRSD